MDGGVYMEVGTMTNAAINAYGTRHSGKVNETKKAGATDDVKKYGVTGKTIGEPKLSEAAKNYYDELKSKFGNMDFILVSSDMKEMAKANAGSYANAQKMVVLIDEEKLERMATDEKYRKQYEGIILSAGNKLPELQKAFGNSSGVKGFGMQVNDNGTTSFFAVMKKSFNDQADRIEKLREKKAEAKKDAKKKAEKLEEKERLQELRQAKDEDVVIWANSEEELIQKIQDYTYEQMADSVRTEEELSVGTVIDFKG